MHLQTPVFTVAIIGIMMMVMALAAPPKVLALDTGQALEITVVPAASILAVAAASYLYYKNRGLVLSFLMSQVSGLI